MLVKVYDVGKARQYMSRPKHDETEFVANLSVKSIADIPPQGAQLVIEGKKYTVEQPIIKCEEDTMVDYTSKIYTMDEVILEVTGR
jgi:hypothetical protein